MRKNPATIHDIAKELNISASTVSRALSDHPRISKKTKEQVLKIAKALNYRPNFLASNLRKGKGNTIGVIIPVINRHFFANIIHGIESIATPAGFQIVICQSGENLQNEIENIQTLIRNRVSGILISISSQTVTDRHFLAARKSNIPIVMFDRILEIFDAGKIRSDDFQGAFNTTQHLIEQGYKKIAHFSGPLQLPTYRDRYEGYRQALEKNNLTFNKHLVFDDIITREKGSDIMKNLIRSRSAIDAIFAASDMSALGALLAAKEMKIKVPELIGMAGYVNEPFSEFIEPSLTSTEQFGEEMGKKAAQMIIQEILSGTLMLNETIKISPKLIIRNSSNRQA